MTDKEPIMWPNKEKRGGDGCLSVACIFAVVSLVAIIWIFYELMKW